MTTETSNPPSATADQEKTLRRNEKKWTRSVMAAGWTAIPSILLEKQHALSLTPTDLNIILQLAKHWWFADEPPYPSKETIAVAIGIKPRQVQRRIAIMERLGYLKREKRTGPYGTNIYHFDGLVEKLKPFAAEALKQREAVAEDKNAWRRRKRAHLEGKKGEE